jgi:hypothetical protein
LAVEIRQYVGEGLKTLVPEVIGHTLEERPPIEKWDEPSFLKEMATKHGPAEMQVARDILKWSKENMDRIWWGEGKTQGSFTTVVDHKGASHYPIYVVTNGIVYIQFYYLKMKPPFDSEDLRRELLKRINEAPGVNIPQEYIAKGPSIPLKTFENRDALEKFFSALSWMVQQIKSS